MLYNGENIGDGSPPQTDIAVDRSTARRPSRSAVGGTGGHRRSERGTMFDPGPCVYMEKIAVGPRARARSTSRCRRRRPRVPGQGARTTVRDLTASSSTAPPRGADRPGAPSRGPHPAHHRREWPARWRRCVRTSRVLTCSSGSAGPLRACSPPQPSSGRGRDPRAALAAQRRRARRAVAAATTSAPCSTPTTSSRATTSSSRRPASPTATSLQGVRYLDFGATTQSCAALRARGRCGRSTPSTRSPSWRVQRLVLNRHNGSLNGGPWSRARCRQLRQAAGRRDLEAQVCPVERRGDVEQLEVDLGSSSAPASPPPRLPDRAAR